MSLRNTMAVGLASAVLLCASTAWAKPPGAKAFCEQYPDIPVCVTGDVNCTTCHTVAPANNAYGASVAESLVPEAVRPLSDDAFLNGLGAALTAIEELDSDSDSFSNIAELRAGTDPSDGKNFPKESDVCDQDNTFWSYDVCEWDADYVFKKLHLDFCGYSPTLEQKRDFAAADDQRAALTAALDVCLDSEYWMGVDGALWNLANKKIGPQQAIKSGENAGPIPLADYNDDYNFFVYHLIDGRDARDLLLASYIVLREGGKDGVPSEFSTYTRSLTEDFNVRGFDNAQLVQQNKRAGLLTHRWFIMINVMFTSLPRTAAAQAYRSYLGLDISKMEGLVPVPGEPVDYDNKAVQEQECAVCHSTLDPLTYPFSRYEGIGGGDGDQRIPFTYNPGRLQFFESIDGTTVSDTPEQGYIFGQEVNNLYQWADVAANSEAFAKTLVLDFWKLTTGEAPRASELAEYQKLYKDLMEKHNYSAEAMLHDLIFTEAYGVP